ncbi:MAG: cysteine desulfurase [Proteobacteria bacterium]|nr:cysteine desulfurase [Pseudomonadota bacterium]
MTDLDAVYLDHNATTPLDPRVLQAMMPYLAGGAGNASSLHRLGQRARQAVDVARQQVAALIGASPDEVFFVSGGTEADNWALRAGVAAAAGARDLGGPAQLVTTTVEHSAVLQTAERLRAQGVTVTLVEVDAAGRVDPEAFAAALTPKTALVSVMLANNDVGTIQPVAAIAALARQAGVWIHSDAVQAVGKIAVDVRTLEVDLLALSAHKLGGPQGAGALFVRRGLRLPPLLEGGGQERGRRGGTENVAAIVGFGRAAELARSEWAEGARRTAELRERLELGLLARIPRLTINGREAPRLPNTLSVSCAGVDGLDLVLNLDLAGVAASTGAACSSGRVAPSHVLRAMGRDAATAREALRLSLGASNSEGEIDRTIEVMAEAVARLRAPATSA